MAIIRCPICDELGIVNLRPAKDGEKERDIELPIPTGCLYSPGASSPAECDTPRWYAVHTRPNMEKKADIELRRLGYRTFYPFNRRRRYVEQRGKKAEKRVWVERPQFSRYLFVALLKRGNEWQSLYGVNNADAVSTVVYGPDGPLRIPSQVMTNLMEICDARGMVEAKDLTQIEFDARPGDEVRFILDHPFGGLVATVASVELLDKTGEISVWLNALGRDTKVTAPATAVIPARTQSQA